MNWTKAGPDGVAAAAAAGDWDKWEVLLQLQLE